MIYRMEDYLAWPLRLRLVLSKTWNGSGHETGAIDRKCIRYWLQLSPEGKRWTPLP